ncbi:MAG: hypothetical protein EA405_07545 [Rhodospirillales bacterium]|nr:MAG: hypothetical protein EA405_07545 [Rhodospirillales bacterium]
MLTDLYAQLTRLHEDLQKLSAGPCGDDEAAQLFARIAAIERKLVTFPPETIDDAIIKLQMLRMEAGGDLPDWQRQMLGQVVSVLKREAGSRQTASA